MCMESNIEYGLLGFLVWIHVCGLWVVGCKKPNPRMNSCMESRVWNQVYGILPLRLDSWFNCKVMELGLEQTLTNPCVWFVYGL